MELNFGYVTTFTLSVLLLINKLSAWYYIYLDILKH